MITEVAEKKTGLSGMKEELLATKTAAEEMLDNFKDVKPEDIDTDEDFEEKNKSEEEGPEEGKEDKDHPVEIKTPEDAKKVLEEAKEDITQVVENLEGVIGQAGEEEEKVAFKRQSSKYETFLKSLAKEASQAIEDAEEAMNHWAFLQRRITKKKKANLDLSEITDPNLKQVASTLHQMSLVEKAFNKLGFVKKEATAVPPTGAKFTGDKIVGKTGDPAQVELKHFEAGVNEFKRDKKKEDSMPNSSDENRLNDLGNPHDEKPFVNASFNPGNEFEGKMSASYDIYDGKTGKAIRFSFKNAPSYLGSKDEKGLSKFASSNYANLIIDAVRVDGIESVRNYVGGQYITNQRIAAKTKDKAGARKYYSEAFGDASYAKELTSAKGDKEMDIAYKPEKDCVENSQDNPGFGKAKDGVGKISNKKADLIKARKLVEIGRKAAAAGLIPFNKTALKAYGTRLFTKSTAELEAIEASLNAEDIVNVAALKEGHIPESETGITGNTAEGVRDTKAKADTENLNPTVSGDAKIAKKASFVPQISQSSPQGLQISGAFTTTKQKLQSLGVNLQETRLRLPSRRNG
jgi:hypothetical protein